MIGSSSDDPRIDTFAGVRRVEGTRSETVARSLVATPAREPSDGQPTGRQPDLASAPTGPAQARRPRPLRPSGWTYARHSRPLPPEDAGPADESLGQLGAPPHRIPALENRHWSYRAIVWSFRALLLVPFILMGPEIISAVSGRPRGFANLGSSVADVLGTSIFVIFIMMLAVTPVQTMTGWRWHVVLRRDYGVAMFVVAATDLTIAAITTGDTFPGGFFSRVGGHTFLFAGTLSTLLALPLAVTANRRARRWLGRYWKWLHRLTYVLWVSILIHLLLLFGLRALFLDAALVSLPLAVLRLPALRRWWESSRRAKTHFVARWIAAVALVSVFVAGYAPFARELAKKGVPAFTQRPSND